MRAFSLLLIAAVALVADVGHASRLERIGLLPSLAADGSVIGVETVDNAALAAVRAEARGAEVVAPSALRDAWSAAGCTLDNAGCVRRFAQAHRLDGVVAIVLEPGPNGVDTKTVFLEGEAGSKIVQTEGALSDPEQVEAETRARVTALMSTALAHGDLAIEVSEPDASIALDGAGIGTSPYVNTLKWVAAGEHTLRADTRDGRSVSQVVTVTPGETVSVLLDFSVSGPAPDEEPEAYRFHDDGPARSPDGLLWTGVGVAGVGAAVTLVGAAWFAWLVGEGAVGGGPVTGMIPSQDDGGAMWAGFLSGVSWAVPIAGAAVMATGAAVAGFSVIGSE